MDRRIRPAPHFPRRRWPRRPAPARRSSGYDASAGLGRRFPTGRPDDRPDDRTEIPAGPEGAVEVDQVHDFAWVFGDGQPLGVMDRRARRYSVRLPARSKPMQIAFLVESLGHVNFGNEIHDRKGLLGSVKFTASSAEPVVLKDHWQTYRLPLDATTLSDLKWKSSAATGPAFWRGSFEVTKPADTFLDLLTLPTMRDDTPEFQLD
jgi:hypothetical protein